MPILTLGLLCNILWISSLNGQNISKDSKNKIEEKVLLVTDRSVYCIGEKIIFNVVNHSDAELRKSWSKVLYVELITPSGKPYFQGKFPFSSEGSKGQITIPVETLTGNYYVRAYTKWMRNSSPYYYAYQIVTIINPTSNEILQPLDSPVDSSVFDNSLQEEDSSITIKTANQIYSKREPIEFNIQLKDAQDFMGGIISVVRKGSESFSLEKNISEINHQEISLDEFIPETRGVSISGKVVNKTDSLPLSYAKVCLTLIGKSKEYLTSITDSSGKFYFSLSDHFEPVEIFISANPTFRQGEPLVLVENDFCNHKVVLPFIPFNLDDTNRISLNVISVNSQIERKYRTKVDSNSSFNTSDKSFYGNPTTTIHFEDFILLNNFEDYFKELIPSVKIVKENNKRRFKIIGSYSDLTVYEPLVMVDYIPIFDLESLLPIIPQQVERIEVISKPYILGDIVFGGIIHIISKDGKYAGVSLPSAGQFFKIQTFEPLENYSKLEFSNEPIVKNSLFHTNFDINYFHDNQLYKLYSGDVSGEYIINVKLYNIKGELKRKTCSFRIIE